MRHPSFVLGALAACAVGLPGQLQAQTGYDPRLVITVFAGALTGHPLWGVGRQPIEVRDTAPTFAPTGLYDTLRLSRRVTSSLTAGMSATYYPSEYLGYQLELSYLGLTLESGCSMLNSPPMTDADQKNTQLCNSIAAGQVSASALAVHGGITLRASSRGSFSPYVRAAAGLTSIGRSTIATEGSFNEDGQTYSRALVVEGNPGSIDASFLIGIGLTSPLGPGYQYRLEIHDILASQTRLDGAVNGLGLGPSSKKMYHHFALLMGIDIVLERKRGRRY